jgi:hypothetical protein
MNGNGPSMLPLAEAGRMLLRNIFPGSDDANGGSEILDLLVTELVSAEQGRRWNRR